jgi:predicted membrane-bound spermidine synthase
MLRPVALALTVMTGFTGLVYEVVWQKYLGTLLGSHSEATAAVLAIFLGGLSAGYALFGRVTRGVVERARARGTRPRLLYVYALLEMGIGLYALAFPWIFGLGQRLSFVGSVESDGLGFALDVALSTLLIGPPAVLMGGTIPMLTLALAGSVAQSTRVHSWVYGFNTIGGFGGALAAAFLLIPWLGLDESVQLMGCLNLMAAAVFAQLDRTAEPVAPKLAGADPTKRPVVFGVWAGVSLLAGFAMMALQTTFNRVGALTLGSSQFTFAMVVAVFVLCIALGSLAVSLLPRIPRALVVGSQWLLVLLLFPIYLGISDVTYWGHVVRALFSEAAPAFYAYHLGAFTLVLILIGVPVGISGALLPLLFHELRRELGELGALAGRLYAWNTVGSLLGALLGGYLLLVWLDLHHVYRIAMAALALGAGLLSLLVLRGRVRAVGGLVVVPALAAIWLLPAWDPDQLAAGLFRHRNAGPATFMGPTRFFAQRDIGHVIFYDDDPTSSVAVLEPAGRPGQRGIVVNGKSDGNLAGDYPTMALSGLVPALMAESSQDCFVIGLGTGVTAGELGALDGTDSVRVAEISRGVIAASPLFDLGNLDASKNPKVEVHRGDAYRTLLQSDRRYDVIVSEPSNPWVSGVEMLYSREFLTAARSRLKPGGVYGQWFHVYESDVEVVSIVLRTYASVFPHVSVWYALGSDLLLLGFDRPDRALDVDALAARFRQPDYAAGFGRVGIETLPQLFAHELLPLGTLHAVPQAGATHTLRHPILSDRAARAFFRGRHAWLPPYLSAEHQRVASRNSLLRRLNRGAEVLSEEILEAAARETCAYDRREECATLFTRWGLDYPSSDRREAVLAEARRKSGGAQPQLNAGSLRRLRSLYDGSVRPVGAKAALRQAERLTSRFVQYYHHAVPFDRAVVDAAWSRCTAPECEERRRLASQRLSDDLDTLDAEAQSGSPSRQEAQ